MVQRTKAPSTLLLEQFKRQAYYTLYVEGRTLVEFTAMMDKLFKKIRDDTQVELQVGYNQWQTRKRAWDNEWKITEGGPSTEALKLLDKLPIWFDSNKDWLTQTHLKLEEPKLFEQTTKPYTPFDFTKPEQTLYEPGWKGINRASESQVPLRAFGSDTINFDYTDATASQSLTCMSGPYTKPSYDNFYPAGCLDGALGEAILPSEQLLGLPGPLDGQKSDSALTEEYTSPEKFPLAYTNSVFNEGVSNFDHENWEQFSAAVNTHHLSMGTKRENFETFHTGHAQGPGHTPLNRSGEQRPNLTKPHQNISMYPYGPLL